MKKLIDDVLNFLLGGFLMFGAVVSMVLIAADFGYREAPLWALVLGLIMGGVFVMTYAVVTEFPQDFSRETGNLVRMMALILVLIGWIGVSAMLPAQVPALLKMLILIPLLRQLISR